MRRVGSGIALFAVLLAIAPAAAQAATITPTRVDDPPGAGSCPADCSLRQAIAAAGAGGTVSLTATTYKLTLGIVAIGSDLTIAGPGASLTAITGGGTQQIFSIANGNRVTISGVTLTGGLAPAGSNRAGGRGGAIVNNGVLTLAAVALNRNAAAGGVPTEKAFAGGGGEGGAIENDGLLTIVGGELVENTSRSGSNKFGLETTEFAASGGRGGAIHNQGAMFVAGTTLRANLAEAGLTGTVFPSQGGNGGAIQNGATARIVGASFLGNTASAGTGGGGGGGAINSGGTLAVLQSEFSANVASGAGTASGSGGAIEAFDAATVQQSSFDGNHVGGTGGEGGAIRNSSSLVLQQSTLSANTSEGSGGAITNSAELDASNSTIANNTAATFGGGVENFSTAVLANTTLTGNTASATNGGNLFTSGAALQLHDSLLVNGKVTGAGGENCAGPGNLVSLGFNLEDRNQCQLTASGDQVNVAAPLLAPLAANGGPTQTAALLPGSPAIDAGDPAGCTGPTGEALSVDQRSVARPQGPRCDIGAFELVRAAVMPPVAPVVKPPIPVPSISALRLSPSTFRAAAKGPTIASAKRKGTGTTITYSDSLAATTSFTILRSTPGVRSGRRCVAPPKHRAAHAKLKRCTRLLAAANFTHIDRAGANRLRFSGRAHAKKLRPGSYTLVAIPKLGVAGKPASARFTITS
jgi:hypothetical protein